VVFIAGVNGRLSSRSIERGAVAFGAEIAYVINPGSEVVPGGLLRPRRAGSQQTGCTDPTPNHFRLAGHSSGIILCLENGCALARSPLSVSYGMGMCPEGHTGRKEAMT
jgi:hypothetical protein